MKLFIRGAKLEITEAIESSVKSKLERLDKYFDNPDDIKAYVNIRVDKLSEIIEVTIPTKKFTLRAEESNEDLYTAIDLVVDKLERQIRKNKTRIKNKYNERIDFNFDYDEEEIEEEKSVIVKRKDIENKPMDEEEAILQYELLGHDFFIFKNIDEECTSVLYKRKDGNYGILNVR